MTNTNPVNDVAGERCTGRSSASQPADVPEGKGGAVLLFPTVCFVMQHNDVEEVNHELERHCLEQEQNDASLKTGSIMGGYHSHRRIFEDENWAVQKLKQILMEDTVKYVKEFWRRESSVPLETVKDFGMQLSGWSVILREADMSNPHIHPGASISGVYYVNANKATVKSQPGAGNLVLVDPRVRANVAPILSQNSNAMFEPKAGTVVMFPSYVEHFVPPFKGEGARISIAFNIAFSENALSRD